MPLVTLLTTSKDRKLFSNHLITYVIYIYIYIYIYVYIYICLGTPLPTTN